MGRLFGLLTVRPLRASHLSNQFTSADTKLAITSTYSAPVMSYHAGQGVPPPSYDAAMRMPDRSAPASLIRTPPAQPSSDKQFSDYSEKEQRRREQELMAARSMPSSAYASSSSSSSSRAAYLPSPVSVSTSYGAMPLDPKTALARFGSPFATSPDWAPSAHDARLTHLPQVDLETRIKMRFSGPSSEQRALAPPPSFSRHVNPSQAYTSSLFEPVFIRSANNKESGKQLLSDGFQPVYPGRLMVQRNVSAADWGRFLEDLTVAGRLTGKQSIISNVAPMTMHMGVTGFLVTRAIEKRMKKRKDPLICETVETWQQSFYHARNLDVYVLYNGERLTARSPNGPIPVSSYPGGGQLERSHTADSSISSGSSSSSDSDSDDDRHYRVNSTGDRYLDKRQRKMAREQRKQERKLRRAEKKHERKMAKIEKKHKRAKQKYPDLPDWNPSTPGAVASSPSTSRSQSTSRQMGGTRAGYLLVIAPLDTIASKPAVNDAAAFMW